MIPARRALVLLCALVVLPSALCAGRLWSLHENLSAQAAEVSLEPPTDDLMIQGTNQVAVELPVRLTVQNSGVTETVDGGRIWRVKVSSVGAMFLRFNFNAFNLKPGMEMWFYKPGEESTHGNRAVTSEHNSELRTYGSPIVCGDAAVIELFMPDTGNSGTPAFNVDTVSYGYIDFLGCAQGGHLRHRQLDSHHPTEWDCLVDVSCVGTYIKPVSGLQIIGDWTNQINAVAQTFDGTYSCSGAMITNMEQDCTKHYFLTANHCVWSKGVANKLSFYWNLQCNTCTGGGSGVGSDCFNNYDETTGGARYLVGKNKASGTDFTLLEIKNPSEIPSGVFYAGFDATTPASSYAYGTYIHHPGLPGPNYKMITQKQEDINSAPGNTNYWRCNVVDESKFLGDSANGSSGCPLFNPDHRIVGQLYGGGGSTCGSGYDDFGRVDKSWDFGLSAYLDPDNTGVKYADGTYCSMMDECNTEADCTPVDCQDASCVGSPTQCMYTNAADGSNCSGGVCCSGTCRAGTSCDECSDATDCPPVVCQDASCIGSPTECLYENAADESGCPGGGVCCDGACTTETSCPTCADAGGSCNNHGNCCGNLKCRGNPKTCS